jgi:putative RecB family exonuclease
MRTYSYSQLETFATCRLKYKFRYIDKIEKLEESIEAFVGSRVHETLEKLYRELVLEKLNSLEELLDFYRAEWEKNWGQAVKIREPGLKPENYFDYGAKCVRNYYERHRPFNQSRTLKTEAHLIFPLDAKGEYRVAGYIDRIARRPDGTYEIHDYKTGRGLPSKEWLEEDRQLGLYEIGLRSYWPDVQRVELVWHYVGLDSTFRSTRTPEQLQALREESIGAIDRIEREKDFEPRQGAWCDWCEYRPECPLWKHVVAVEALPPAEFAADAGVRLANEYARIKFEMDGLAERFRALRAKIIEFARQRQAHVLQGNGVQVAVTSKESTRFPSKDEPARAQLEEFLKKTGKWEEVKDLSLRQLEAVLRQARWPPELLDQLRQFATTKTGAIVRLRRTELGKKDEDLSGGL